eukprot:TRINITY_DN6404_c0_g4_i1.p1 TRINITY_DN6404_c0_g4~~TRINITY_DN6404_c0_g4_i1.p1  ORF type:complete len:477 (+),score=74.63 TRINITY_DN6404_c0_g4_i1:76-1431(+)
MATPDELLFKQVLAHGDDKARGELKVIKRATFNFISYVDELTCQTCCEEVYEDVVASPCACGPVHLACFCTGVNDLELHDATCRHCRQKYNLWTLLGGYDGLKAFVMHHLVMAVPFAVLIHVLYAMRYPDFLGYINDEFGKECNQLQSDCFVLAPLCFGFRCMLVVIICLASRVPAIVTRGILNCLCHGDKPHDALRIVTLSFVCLLSQSTEWQCDFIGTLVTMSFWAELIYFGRAKVEDGASSTELRRTTSAPVRVAQLNHYFALNRLFFFLVLCTQTLHTEIRRHCHILFFLVTLRPMCRFGKEYFWKWTTRYHANKVRAQLQRLEEAALVARVKKLTKEREEKARAEAHARRMDGNRERAAKLGALAGGVTGATAGGVAGMGVGGALGAVLGAPLALFTFGLSIPAGALLCGSSGLAIGSATGMGAGGLGGGAVGYGAGTLLKMRASR